MKGELIGRELTIIASANKETINMKGTIINETRNTFTIDCNGREKTILKNASTFLINNKKIKGDAILKRPEERTKK